MNHEPPNVQAGFRKGRGTRDQIDNIHWNIHFCWLTTPMPLTVWVIKKCGKFLRRWEYQNTLPASWEICMQVNKQQLKLDMKQQTGPNWERSSQGCILSTCLCNLNEDYIMWNARLDEAQVGIKIFGRNINNLPYADDTTLMAESKELKSLLMKVKEESEKVSLKLSIQKTKIMTSFPIISWQIDGEAMETVTDFILGGWGLQNHWRWWLQHCN